MASTNNNDGAATPAHFDVIVVGAGVAGIGAAIKLQAAGFHFTVLEKAAEVGGVWRENTYPDCACDIPSALYSYSFAPNPNWSRMFAGQEEIKHYLGDIADRYQLATSIKFKYEMLESRWNSQARHWELNTSGGRFTAQFVIMACGPMHQPVFPDIPGLASFTGESFHSAQWDHACDLRGKKVAVIGSGASAIQFVPAIQAEVAQLTLFQRTAPWVLPKMDLPISPKWRARFAKMPLLQRGLRKLLYWQFEFLNSGLNRPGFIKRLQGAASKNITRSIKDESLRDTLTPDYAIGCKRILQSNNWYPALAKDNVTVADGVIHISGNTLIDSSGASMEADVIIFATGFEVANPPVAQKIFGESGISLAQRWQGSPEVYLGTMAEDCPNCFLTFGPNLYAFTSAFVIIEAQLGYILDALGGARDKNVQVLRVASKTSEQYNHKVQAALQSTVWNSGGCSSYFIDQNGRNSTNWPWTTFKLKRLLKRFKLADYQVENA